MYLVFTLWILPHEHSSASSPSSCLSAIPRPSVVRMARDDEAIRGEKVEDGPEASKIENTDLSRFRHVSRRILWKMDTRYA